MFVDEIILDIKAGDGGNGCMAYRREKYIEMGGPDGGSGGRGSDIVFKVKEGLNTLIDLRSFKVIKANKGTNGMGKGQDGRNSEPLIIYVPLGTVITDVDTNLIIGDLTTKDCSVVVAEGGRGGRGNISLATRSNTCPDYCENGEAGEEKRIKLELKLLADVGLVGLPSVGKSTIITKISASKAKVADYHFTTLNPNLGVVKTKDNRSFVVADLPGLIEGASLGLGLGDQFLKHIERTRIIAHIVDMSGIEGRDPYDDYVVINKELETFNKSLMNKKQVVIANKMDLPNSKENLEKFKEKADCEIFEVSAIKSEGLDNVLMKLADELENIKVEPLYEEEKFLSHVLYKFKVKEPFTITRDDNIWVVRGDEVEKLLRMTKFKTDESVRRFAYRLKKMGLDERLIEMGAVSGDIIRILDLEFEFME